MICKRFPETPLLPWRGSGPPWLSFKGECRHCINRRAGLTSQMLHPEMNKYAIKKMHEWAVKNPEAAKEAFTNPQPKGPEQGRWLVSWMKTHPKEAAAEQKRGGQRLVNWFKTHPEEAAAARIRAGEATRQRFAQAKAETSSASQRCAAASISLTTRPSSCPKTL